METYNNDPYVDQMALEHSRLPGNSAAWAFQMIKEYQEAPTEEEQAAASITGQEQPSQEPAQPKPQDPNKTTRYRFGDVADETGNLPIEAYEDDSDEVKAARQEQLIAAEAQKAEALGYSPDMARSQAKRKLGLVDDSIVQATSPIELLVPSPIAALRTGGTAAAKLMMAVMPADLALQPGFDEIAEKHPLASLGLQVVTSFGTAAGAQAGLNKISSMRPGPNIAKIQATAINQTGTFVAAPENTLLNRVRSSLNRMGLGSTPEGPTVRAINDADMATAIPRTVRSIEEKLAPATSVEVAAQTPPASTPAPGLERPKMPRQIQQEKLIAQREQAAVKKMAEVEADPVADRVAINLARGKVQDPEVQQVIAEAIEEQRSVQTLSPGQADVLNQTESALAQAKQARVNKQAKATSPQPIVESDNGLAMSRLSDAIRRRAELDYYTPVVSGYDNFGQPQVFSYEQRLKMLAAWRQDPENWSVAPQVVKDQVLERLAKANVGADSPEFTKIRNQIRKEVEANLKQEVETEVSEKMQTVIPSSLSAKKKTTIRGGAETGDPATMNTPPGQIISTKEAEVRNPRVPSKQVPGYKVPFGQNLKTFENLVKGRLSDIFELDPGLKAKAQQDPKVLNALRSKIWREVREGGEYKYEDWDILDHMERSYDFESLMFKEPLKGHNVAKNANNKSRYFDYDSDLSSEDIDARLTMLIREKTKTVKRPGQKREFARSEKGQAEMPWASEPFPRESLAAVDRHRNQLFQWKGPDDKLWEAKTINDAAQERVAKILGWSDAELQPQNLVYTKRGETLPTKVLLSPEELLANKERYEDWLVSSPNFFRNQELDIPASSGDRDFRYWQLKGANSEVVKQQFNFIAEKLKAGRNPAIDQLASKKSLTPVEAKTLAKLKRQETMRVRLLIEKLLAVDDALLEDAARLRGTPYEEKALNTRLQFHDRVSGLDRLGLQKMWTRARVREAAYNEYMDFSMGSKTGSQDSLDFAIQDLAREQGMSVEEAASYVSRSERTTSEDVRAYMDANDVDEDTAMEALEQAKWEREYAESAKLQMDDEGELLEDAGSLGRASDELGTQVQTSAGPTVAPAGDDAFTGNVNFNAGAQLAKERSRLASWINAAEDAVGTRVAQPRYMPGYNKQAGRVNIWKVNGVEDIQKIMDSMGSPLGTLPGIEDTITGRIFADKLDQVSISEVFIPEMNIPVHFGLTPSNAIAPDMANRAAYVLNDVMAQLASTADKVIKTDSAIAAVAMQKEMLIAKALQETIEDGQISTYTRAALARASLDASSDEQLQERILRVVDSKFNIMDEAMTSGPDLSIDKFRAEAYRDITDIRDRTGFIKDSLEIDKDMNFEKMTADSKEALSNFIKAIREVC